MCLVVIFAALTLVVPALADGGDKVTIKDNQVQGAVGIGNMGVQNSGNMNKATILGPGAELNSTTVNGGIRNSNMNMNMNMNNNSASADASANASADATAVNNTDNTNVNLNKTSQANQQSITIEATEIPRQFAIGTEINYPGMPGYFGPATNQPNYVKAEVITEFQKEFTREYVEAALTSHSGTSFSMKKRFHYYTGKKASADRKATDALTVTINKPEGKKVRVVGYCNIWSTSVNKDSLDVFFSALQDMLNVEGGANTVWLTGEGAMQVVKSFGWGIGLNYSHAFVNGNNDQSGNATGGTGISGGEAGYRAKPFMQLQLLIVE